MLPSMFSLVLRRGLLAVCAMVALLAFAKPADAGTLCPAEDFLDDANGICRNFYPGDEGKFFMFDSVPLFEHLVRITVAEVFEPFGIRLLPTYLAPGQIPGFPAYNCVAYAVGGQCVKYTTVDPTDHTVEQHPDDDDYEPLITWLIAWSQPVGTDPIPEIFHEFGDDPDSIFDEIMEGIFFDGELGPFDFACDEPDFYGNDDDDDDYPEDYFEEGFEPTQCDFYPSDRKLPGDPVRVAVTDSFSGAMMGQVAVPEPALGSLLALMATAGAVRLRRGRR